jgi:hypothetical protein
VQNNFYIVPTNQTEMNNLLSAISYQLSALLVIGLVIKQILNHQNSFSATFYLERIKLVVYQHTSCKLSTGSIHQLGVHPP